MSLIRLQNLSMSYDSRVLLRDVYFRLSKGDRVGLVGTNGSGKTTLLKLILGQEEPTDGKVAVDRGLEIGYFSQFSELRGESTVVEVLDELFAPVHAVETALKEVEVALDADPPENELNRLLLHQASLFDEMERLDGWSRELKMETVLSRLGFNEVHRHRPIDQLSGGWRNRAALAKILLESPQVLLMDEPTNFLDIEGLLWLEEWFNKLPGALILVSHDRHFLDQVVTKVVEIDDQRLQEYEGAFAEYVGARYRRLKTQQGPFEHEEALLAYEATAINQRSQAGGQKRKRPRVNIKRRKGPQPVDKLISGIFKGISVPKDLCYVENLHKAYGDQVVLREASFELHARDRVAVIGPNGCGKTTLLRVFTGAEKPDRGSIEWGARGTVEIAHYNKMLEELQPGDDVNHAVRGFGTGAGAPRKAVNQFLTLFRFSEMDLRQKIGTLSGGQKARLALARCLLSGAEIIVLDEPTNHLDVTSSQVMERALVRFPGAVVVVSHDRFFIDKVATRLLVFGPDGRLTPVKGTWSRMQARGRRSKKS